MNPESPATQNTLSDQHVLSLLQDVLVPCEAGQDEPGDSLGPYRLTGKLGEGGFGVVWQAEQSQPVHREVALKMIKLGMDSREVLARFDQERQVLAEMEHPNIAAMLDANMSADGRPYFVMELVKGDPVTHYCEKRALPVGERILLFMAICRGVQHAHQKGVIHRDLKPSNLLVVEVDGLPVPKIIDFGISKAMTTRRMAELPMMTRIGLAVGTPLYMSPEQISETGQVDTRSDIYALGVLLYELLTGQPPFAAFHLEGRSQAELRRVICEETPQRPSRQARQRDVLASPGEGQLPADLDWIILRALEKEPSRRYPSAAEFAADLQRFLHQQPVLARPPSTGYVALRWIQRHRLAFTAAVVSALALLTGATVAAWQAVLAHRARAAAEAQTARAIEAESRASQTAGFLTKLLGDAAYEIDRGHNPEALQLALDNNREPLMALGKDPQLQSNLLERVARLYSTIGDWKTALQLLKSRVQAVAAVHGAKSPEAREAELTYLKLETDQGARFTVPPLLLNMRNQLEVSEGKGSRFWFELQRELVRAYIKLDLDAEALACSKDTMAEAEKRRLPKPRLQLVHLSHAAILEKIRDYDGAEAILQQCRTYSRGKQTWPVEKRLIYLFKSKGDHAKAAEFLRHRLTQLHKGPQENGPNLPATLLWLSEFESAAGQHESAIRHTQEALTLARQQPSSTKKSRESTRSDIGDALRALASAESAAGQHMAALTHARGARENADGQGQKLTLVKAITCEATVQEAAGHLEEAYKCYGEAQDLREDRLANYRSRTTSLEPMWRIRMAQGRWADAMARAAEMWPRPDIDDPAALEDIDHLGQIANFGLQAWQAAQSANPDTPPPPSLPRWLTAAKDLQELEATQKKAIQLLEAARKSGGT